MTNDPSPDDDADDLQFATAESVEAASDDEAPGHVCAVCQQSIEETYYAIGDQSICPLCRDRLQTAPAGTPLRRLLKASFMGTAAGLVGTLIWFTIRRVASLEIGLVAILVGFMVGKAVRSGSGGRGGRGYQFLAVVITYCCIAANYMPDIFQAVFAEARAAREAAAAKQDTPGESAADPHTPDAGGVPADAANQKFSAGEIIGAVAMLTALVFALSLAAPFLGGAENLIGILIIGFALWEAWKFNARQQLPISGPYQLGTNPAA